MGLNVAKETSAVYRQRFTVAFDYPVHFTRGVFAAHGEDDLACVLDRQGEERMHKVQVYVDGGLARAWPELPQSIQAYCDRHADRIVAAGPPLVMPGGESAKDGWEHVHAALAAMGRRRLDRHSFVVGVGGGAMLDMLGLAASLAHRGLRLVRIPTTTLAQCDASVGVKNGIDQYGMKNFAGTFAPPSGVVIDFDFPRTLAQPDWVAGIAEGFKVAMIKDVDFFGYLCAHARAAAARDETVMEHVVRRCATLHLDHIRQAGDPFETGSSRPLDFGHWAAHQIECMTGHRVAHGQAVAIGLALDAHYAMQVGCIRSSDFDRLATGLIDAGLPVWDSCLEERNANGTPLVLAGLERFREHLGGRLTVTLPDGIGAAREVHAMDAQRIERAIKELNPQGS